MGYTDSSESTETEPWPIVSPVNAPESVTRSKILTNVQVRPSEKSPKGGFQLIIETFNSTGIRQLKQRMRNTDAHIICNQELRLIGEEVNDFKTWATRRG